jgi:hypothetical protein
MGGGRVPMFTKRPGRPRFTEKKTSAWAEGTVPSAAAKVPRRRSFFIKYLSLLIRPAGLRIIRVTAMIRHILS